MKYIKIQLLALILFLFSLSLSAEREFHLVKDRIGYEGFKSIDCPDSLNCFVFTNGVNKSLLYKSTDQGETWYKIYENSHNNNNDSIWSLFHGFAVDTNYLYHTYHDRAILEKSTDGGYSFERVSFGKLSSDENNIFWGMSMYNRNIGVAASRNEIVITKDNWKTYKLIKYPEEIWSGRPIYFLDSNNIALIKINRWTDAFVKYNIEKDEWSEYSKESPYEDKDFKKIIYDVCFVNDSLGFAAGGQDTTENNIDKVVIYKTKDKGKNWEVIFDELHHPNIGLSRIRFKDALHGIGVGGWGMIVETTDGGKSWNYIVPPKDLNGGGLKVAFAGEQIIFGTAYGGLYKLDPPPLGVEKDLIKQEKIKIRQSKDKLLISINDKKYRQHKIEIYNLQGIKLNEHSLSSGFGTLFQPVRIDQYPTGAYFYRISVDGELIHSGKFIK